MSMTPDDRAKVIARAGEAIRDDQAVVMPTDTLYGVFVRAHDTPAGMLDELTGHPQGDDQPRFTLHLADLDVIIPLLDLSSVVARRLFTRLLPGPTRVVLSQPEDNLSRVCRALSVPRGLIDNGTMLAIRVPDHPITRAVLRASGVPAVARQLGASIWGVENNPGIDASMSSESHNSCEPKVVIDDGQTLHQTGSTTVMLDPDGRFTVRQGGAIKEEEVLGMLNTHILFVCTGNTCRSPMAEEIARLLINQLSPTGITITADSAGVAAGDGYPASQEAVDVLADGGIDLSGHQSKGLTPGLVDRADVIYTMTPSHAQAVMQMAPGSVHKVFPLDATHPIADPIGGPIEVYRDVADQLKELIKAKLEEIIA